MNITPVANQSQSLFGSGPEAALGKDDFLRLLVAQLRNQDPLNPVKGEDFAAQLAQFSSLEQLQNMNANLQNNLEMDLLLNQALNNTLATTLIGNKVKAIGNSVTKTAGEDAEMHYRLASTAQKVTINITDTNGVVVRTVELSGQTSGDHSFAWDGKDNSGNELSEGVYQFSVAAEDGSGNDIGALTFISGLISGIRYNNGAAMLLLGDVEISMADVFEIGFNPGASQSQVRRESIGNDR